MVKLDKCARDNNGLFEVSFEIDNLDPEIRYRRGELSYANLFTIRMAEQELDNKFEKLENGELVHKVVRFYFKGQAIVKPSFISLFFYSKLNFIEQS